MDIETNLRFDYCEKLSENGPEILNEITRQTHLKTLAPRMLSGQLQGRLLSFIVNLLQPKYILEIGTFTAYATVCLSEGLGKDAKIITIEANDEYEQIIKSHLELSGKRNQIELKIGNAIEIIPTLEQTFDLVFIDAKKLDYEAYYKLVFDKVRSGGVIIFDNVLWSDKVLDLDEHTDVRTHSLHRLNQMIKNDDRVENFILPLRDGLNILRKK